MKEEVTIWKARSHPGGGILASGPGVSATVDVDAGERDLLLQSVPASLGELLMGSSLVLAEVGRHATPIAYRVIGGTRPVGGVYTVFVLERV